MVIIGSTAIKYWFSDFNRVPKDLDVVCYEGEELNLILDYERIERLPNSVLLDYLKSVNYNNKYLSPDLLYTLKMSHAVGWQINWEKHVFDIQFLKSKGCKLNKELFLDLYAYWNTTHEKNKRSDLAMSAEEFFDNAVKCPHDHDFLHTLINPTPTFNKVLKDGAEVEVSEEKFNSLSHEEKCDLVREEVFVMAYERKPKVHFLHGYSWMLKKFIINHAPLWEACWILENYIELHKAPYNFVEKINTELEKLGLETTK